MARLTDDGFPHVSEGADAVWRDLLSTVSPESRMSLDHRPACVVDGSGGGAAQGAPKGVTRSAVRWGTSGRTRSTNGRYAVRPQRSPLAIQKPNFNNQGDPC